MSTWPFGGLERKTFGAIAVDPPWSFRSRTSLQSRNWDSARDVEKHYQCMSSDEIAALPVGELAAPNCHLFLWITGPMLIEGAHLPIMKAWGFKPSSLVFTWAKLRSAFKAEQFRFLPTADCDFHVGLGLTSRKCCEFVVLGRKAKSMRVAKNVRELILAPRREHSRKPDEFYSRVEAYCAGPYLELFAREQRPNWARWGLEKDKFDVAALRNETIKFEEAAE